MLLVCQVQRGATGATGADGSRGNGSTLTFALVQGTYFNTTTDSQGQPETGAFLTPYNFYLGTYTNVEETDAVEFVGIAVPRDGLLTDIQLMYTMIYDTTIASGNRPIAELWRCRMSDAPRIFKKLPNTKVVGDTDIAYQVTNLGHLHLDQPIEVLAGDIIAASISHTSLETHSHQFAEMP